MLIRGRAVAAVGCLLLAGCSATSAPAPSCTLTDAPLPDWARTGFRPPDQPEPILWVPKETSTGPLRIDGTLTGSSPILTQDLRDGPGPSTVDVPAPGCRTFELSWPGHHDRVSVAYQPG